MAANNNEQVVTETQTRHDCFSLWGGGGGGNLPQTESSHVNVDVNTFLLVYYSFISDIFSLTINYSVIPFSFLF